MIRFVFFLLCNWTIYDYSGLSSYGNASKDMWSLGLLLGTKYHCWLRPHKVRNGPTAEITIQVFPNTISADCIFFDIVTVIIQLPSSPPQVGRCVQTEVPAFRGLAVQTDCLCPVHLAQPCGQPVHQRDGAL